MPKIRKLEQEEVRTIENRGKGRRKLIEEQYDTFIQEYNPGDYGEAQLETNENRLTVRKRLRAAAARRGRALEFLRTRGNMLRFRVREGQDRDQFEDEEPEAEQEREIAAPTRMASMPRRNKDRRIAS